jgi:hypothetical protein
MAATLAGCGGGGGATPSTGGAGSSGGGGTPAAKSANLPIAITIPQPQAVAAKRPHFVSPATQSLSAFVYAPGTTPPSTPSATINLNAQTQGCSLNAAGTSLTCTVLVANAPLGTANVEIETFSGQNGTGSVLASATQSVTVTPGMPAVDITLDGTPAQISLSLQTPVLASGSSGSSVLNVNAYDAGGNLIVAPGTFSSPLTIASDSSAVSLSSTTASSPGTQITVTYSGGAAPYAVHLTGSGGGVAANMIVNATLDITPSQSLAILGGSNSSPLAYTVIGLNVINEPPQSQLIAQNPLGSPPSGNNIPEGGFAASGNGTWAIGAFGSSGCAIAVYPTGSTTFPTPTTLTPSSDASFSCPVAFEPNGNLLVASNGGGGSEISEYTVSATGALTATGKTIPLVGGSIPSGSVGATGIAVNAAGNIAVLSYTGSTYYALTYNSINSTASPVQAISLPLHSTASPAYVALAPNGSVAVLYDVYSTSSYQVDVYTSSGTLAGSIVPSNTALPYQYVYGIGVDSAADVLVLNSAFNSAGTEYGVFIDVYPTGAYGTVAPQRSIVLSNAAEVQEALAGPIVLPSAAPPAASNAVSGDMLGYAANRTWTYLVTPNYGTPYYVGVYADPQLVNGSVRLVGYQSATSNPFTTGTIIGSVDMTPRNGGYLAAAFASVSSGTAGVSGSVPGTPLFVPNSLSLNQVWNPLQNQAFINLSGATASAQVVAIGSASTACPSGSSSNGATVEYSVTSTNDMFAGGGGDVTYVPGCGITGLSTGDGTTVALQSVGSMPTLGQVTVPAGQPAIIAALHALWQKTFNVHPPKN